MDKNGKKACLIECLTLCVQENKTPKPEKGREEKGVIDVPHVSVFQGQVACKHLDLKNKKVGGVLFCDNECSDDEIKFCRHADSHGRIATARNVGNLFDGTRQGNDRCDHKVKLNKNHLLTLQETELD